MIVATLASRRSFPAFSVHPRAASSLVRFRDLHSSLHSLYCTVSSRQFTLKAAVMPLRRTYVSLRTLSFRAFHPSSRCWCVTVLVSGSLLARLSTESSIYNQERHLSLWHVHRVIHVCFLVLIVTPKPRAGTTLARRHGTVRPRRRGLWFNVSQNRTDDNLDQVDAIFSSLRSRPRCDVLRSVEVDVSLATYTRACFFGFC